jgi:hypothetical protein
MDNSLNTDAQQFGDAFSTLIFREFGDTTVWHKLLPWMMIWRAEKAVSSPMGCVCRLIKVSADFIELKMDGPWGE